MLLYAPAQITGTSTIIPKWTCPKQIPLIWLKLTAEQMRCEGEITWNLSRGAEQSVP